MNTETSPVHTLFALSSRERAWLVETGSVDVFLELPSSRNSDGPRRHLFRVPEGGALFGLTAENEHCSVAGLPFPGTRIAETSIDTIPAERLEGLLEQWIELMTGAVAEDAPPRRYDPLEAGSETALDNQPVSPRAGVVWAQVVEGEARFLGDRGLRVLTPGDAVPVCAKAWLEPVASARFAAFSTLGFLSPETAAKALEAFHELALARLSQIAAREESLELSQTKKRTHFDAARMDGTLRKLAAPLDPAVAREPATTGARPSEGSLDQSFEAWLAACRAIGPRIDVGFSMPSDRGGTGSPADPLDAIAEVSRTRYRQVVLSADWWRGEHGPLLGQRESDRAPVALLPAGRGYECFDPFTGVREKVTAQVAATLEGLAWSFYPPFPLEKIGVGGLLRFGLRGAKPELWLIVLAGAGVAVAAMAVPLATGYAFDTLIPGARRNMLAIVALLLLVTTLCGSLFELLRGFVLLRLEGKLDAKIQAAVWDRLLELPTNFFRRYSAGDLAARGLGIQAMREVLTGSVVTSLLSGVFSLSSFALLIFYDAKLALAAACLTLVAFAFVASAGYLQTRQQRRMAEVKGRLSGLLLQLIGGVVKIRVSAAQSRAFSVWATLFADLKTISVRSRVVTNRVAMFNATWPVLCSIALFSIYANGLTTPLIPAASGAPPPSPPLSTGDFVGFLTAFTQLLTAALGLASALNSVAAIAPAYERARPILEAVPETGGVRSQPGELRGKIEVRHVSFRYSEDTPLILKDVSLLIEPGSFAAIVGSSGSGKSTLFRMLLGFETAVSGSVYYDQQDLNHLDARAVRRQIGVVLQNGRIRAGSLFQNIVGSSRLTLDNAWEAARMAGFDADIESMSMGMQTVLGEGGGTLSGGQRQRLLIARALVRRPRIIFFDEATSALDNQTQAIVSRSLDALRATRVVIAHRLSTIERADRIYVLDQGQLIEEGSYAELMAQGGSFAALAKRQIT